MLKYGRAKWDWRMSPYERRRRSNVLRESDTRLPNRGNAETGQRDSGHLAGFRHPPRGGVGLRAGISRRMRRNTAMSKPRNPWRMRAPQRLNLGEAGKTH